MVALAEHAPGPLSPQWTLAWAARCSALSPQGKPDLNTALPVRQTASIFKQPVTKITNHPSNKVKSDPQKAVDQPRQVRTFSCMETVRSKGVPTFKSKFRALLPGVPPCPSPHVWPLLASCFLKEMVQCRGRCLK
jgi:hypothetical protein